MTNYYLLLSNWFENVAATRLNFASRKLTHALSSEDIFTVAVMDRNGKLGDEEWLTYGKHTADIRPTYGRHTPDIRPKYGRHKPDIRPTYGRHTPDIRPKTDSKIMITRI